MLHAPMGMPDRDGYRLLTKNVLHVLIGIDTKKQLLNKEVIDAE